MSGLGAGSRDGGCHSLVLLPFVSLPPECVPARSGATRSGAAAAQGVPFARESSKPGRMTLRGGKVGQIDRLAYLDHHPLSRGTLRGGGSPMRSAPWR